MTPLTRAQILQTADASRELVAAALDKARMIGADDGPARAIIILEIAYAMVIAGGFRDGVPDVERVVGIAQRAVASRVRLALTQIARKREGGTVQ